MTPRDPQRKLRSGEARPLRVRLLGGLLIFVLTLFRGPARRSGNGRGREGAGLYPELALLGSQEGKSPGALSAFLRQLARYTAEASIATETHPCLHLRRSAHKYTKNVKQKMGLSLRLL